MKRSIFTKASLAGAALLLLSGCSTPSSQPTTAAAGEPVATISDVAHLKVAFFTSGASNEYLKVGIEEAQSLAAKEGFSLDVFDGQWDAKVQFDQIQQALTNGKYNAFAVMPIDGNLVCDILTKDAPAAGVMVSALNVPLCGRATKSGDQVWEPGTVTFVGGQAPEVYQAWVEDIIKTNPKGGNIALISGPPLSANTINFLAAAEAFKTTPGFKIIAGQKTDYTTPQGFAAAQTMLQANPEINMVLSNYTGMTRGIIQATAGKDVKVYDFGGDQWALDNVKSGVLSGSVMMLPRTESREAVQAIVDLVNGLAVSHFINLAASASLPGTPFVSLSNLGSFKAEY